jgi:predicted amidohydrolase
MKTEDIVSNRKTVRVSTIQLPAIIEGDSAEAKERLNLQYTERMLAEAGERKSNLVLMGEYANLYHRSTSNDPYAYRPESIPGRTTESVSALAVRYQMNVVLPVYGSYDGVVSSYAVVIGRNGAITGAYRKTHPTEQEQLLGMVPGDDLPVFELDCCTIGCMTCMDIEYPEVAQVLMLQGAEILLFPHVQASWGEVDWEIRYRARAIDTGLYLVSACYGYPDGMWSPGMMIGRSGIVGRDGLILADAGRSIEVVTADIDIDARRITDFYFRQKLDRTLAVKASRRPELYRLLSDPATRRDALDFLRRIRK